MRAVMRAFSSDRQDSQDKTVREIDTLETAAKLYRQHVGNAER